MIDRQALKISAKQSMSGKKPSVFLVAAAYVAVFSVLWALVYTLSGYDKFLTYIEQIFPVTPYLTYAEVEAALPVITPMAGILILSILMIKIVIDVGYMGYCLKISRNEETDTKAIFDGFAFFFKIIWLELLQIIFVLLWSVLFVVPGIIAYYSYRQAFFILLDNPQSSPMDCIRQSKSMMNGYKLELLFVDFSFLGWFILDQAITLFASVPLFSVWLSPYAVTTRAGFYNMLVAGNEPVMEAG